MPDARKTLQELNEQWSHCTACSLGVRRQAVQGQFVAGEGIHRGIMFIGEGPGQIEEEEGRPFVGPSGGLLRTVINRLGLVNYYITNVVPCRSCSPILDADNNPRFRKDYKSGQRLPMVKDEPPLPTQMQACSTRLYEEIYIVDPVIIVTLGVTPAQMLLGHSVAITQSRGQTEHAYIPGAGYRPVLTEKKGVWARKIHGEFEMPVEQNEVMYEVLPTLHPAYVLRKLSDKGKDSPFQQLVGDIRMAIKIYERYMYEAFGIVPSGTSDSVCQNEDVVQI